MTEAYQLTLLHEYGPATHYFPVIERIHALVAERAEELSVPPFSLTVVLSCDMSASIARYGEPGFHAERLGGMVAGKTLPQVHDYSNTMVVLDAAADMDVVDIVHLATHEYGHVLQGRLRAAAGTRPARPTRDQTPEETAAILAFEAADEFRCDLLSNVVLNTVILDVDGSRRPMHLGDAYGDGYFDALAGILDSRVHPGWPDLVEAYRNWKIDLGAMFGKLVNEADQVLTLIGHAEAVALASGQPPTLDRFRAHPAVERYLAPMWTPIRRVLEGAAMIPPLAEFGDVDRALQDSGRGIVEAWGRLGIQGRLTEDHQVYLDVGDPVR